MPGVLKQVIHYHCSSTASEIAENRAKVVRRWTDRAAELHSSDADLKQSMDPVVSSATRGKRLLLFKEMLEASGYDDLAAVGGADLTGQVPVTGVLPSKISPALLTDEALSLRAILLRDRGASLACSSGDPDIDPGVWAQTLEEVASGWLEGPCKEKDVLPSQPILVALVSSRVPRFDPQMISATVT